MAKKFGAYFKEYNLMELGGNFSLDTISHFVYGEVGKNKAVITVRPPSANNSMEVLSNKIDKSIFVEMKVLGLLQLPQILR
jgi:hypothetical protein